MYIPWGAVHSSVAMGATEDRQLDYQPYQPETDSKLLIWHVCAEMGLQMPLSEFTVTCDHTVPLVITHPTEMIKGLEHLSYAPGEAERADTVQPGERKAQGDLTNVYKQLMGEGV